MSNCINLRGHDSHEFCLCQHCYCTAHVHEESDETIIIIDGSAYLRLNERDFTLTKGAWDC